MVTTEKLMLPTTSELSLYPYAGVPYYRRPGAPPRSSKVNTKLSKYGRSSSVAVRAAAFNQDNPDAIYLADVVAFVELDIGGTAVPMAYVAWYTDASNPPPHVQELGMRYLRREKRQNAHRPFTDLVILEDTIEPAYIQPDPLLPKIRFLYNKFVR